jgi:hypothetical protein
MMMVYKLVFVAELALVYHDLLGLVVVTFRVVVFDVAVAFEFTVVESVMLSVAVGEKVAFGGRAVEELRETGTYAETIEVVFIITVIGTRAVSVPKLMLTVCGPLGTVMMEL